MQLTVARVRHKWHTYDLTRTVWSFKLYVSGTYPYIYYGTTASLVLPGLTVILYEYSYEYLTVLRVPYSLTVSLLE